MPPKMFPQNAPTANQSIYAEPKVYWLLHKQLSDEFTVIHSLPWLSAAAKEIGNPTIPTGEIDFLILHPNLGILALEVKGGRIGYDRTQFVYLNSGEKFDPVTQVRKGTHGLAKWIGGKTNIYQKMGYAIVFPDADMDTSKLPPALVDYSRGEPQRFALDRKHLNNLGQWIINIMNYWKKELNTPTLSPSRITEIVDAICPVADYTPSWTSRIREDNHRWLILTPEQQDCMKRIIANQRFAITGRSGTGWSVPDKIE